MADYAGAPCIGKWHLFEDDDDGTGPETTGYVFPHEAEAKALCAQCPFIARCLVENRASDLIVGGTLPTDPQRRKR